MHSSILKSAIQWNRVSINRIIFNRKLTSQTINRRSPSTIFPRIDSIRTFNTAGRGSPSTRDLTSLLADDEFFRVTLRNNPVIRMCLNAWHLGRFRVKYDRTFRLDEFQVGAKQACIVVTKKLFKMDFNGLHGLMSEEILNRLRPAMKKLSKEERAKFDIQDSDIPSWKPSVSIGYRRSPSGDDFFEIRLVYFWFRGLETIMKKRPIEYRIDGGVKLRGRGVIGNVRFAKRLTPSVDTNWTITHANFFWINYDHVKPSTTARNQEPIAPASNQPEISTAPPSASNAIAGRSQSINAAAVESHSNGYSMGRSSTTMTSRPDPQNHHHSDADEEDGEDEALGLVSLNSMVASKSKSVVVNSKLRADAKEFVPSFAVAANEPKPPSSYARAVAGSSSGGQDDSTTTPPDSSFYDYSQGGKDVLCPYHSMGHCGLGDDCPYTHGIVCDMCQRAVLLPDDPEQNAQHHRECMATHERDMEYAFAVARGENMQCGVCMETVMEKQSVASRRFGILPGCKHCFCLDCIRKWRRAEQFENKVVRACPECRVRSDFVIPSTVWVEDDQEKGALLDAYQSSMKQKTCKYFRGTTGNESGEGGGSSSTTATTECPFGNKCFYRHADPTGRVVEGESPRAIRRRQQARRRTGPDFSLWDFLAEQDWFRMGGGNDDSDDDDDDWFLEMTIDGLMLVDSSDDE